MHLQSSGDEDFTATTILNPLSIDKKKEFKTNEIISTKATHVGATDNFPFFGKKMYTEFSLKGNSTFRLKVGGRKSTKTVLELECFFT